MRSYLCVCKNSLFNPSVLKKIWQPICVSVCLSVCLKRAVDAVDKIRNLAPTLSVTGGDGFDTSLKPLQGLASSSAT